MAKGVKTGGRQKGTPNKVTQEFRDTVKQLLADNRENVAAWLALVANGHGDVKPAPDKALDLLAKLAEFGAPKMSRTEIAGDPDAPLNTVQRIELVPLDGNSKD